MTRFDIGSTAGLSDDMAAALGGRLGGAAGRPGGKGNPPDDIAPAAA